MKNDDVKLIQRVLDGDDIAFSTLVRKYQKSVHALVWRKIGDFHIAEDITQDTFLKAYQKLATLKEPQSFASWLYVIATNRCKTWLRKKRLSTQALQNTSTVALERAAYAGYVIEENEQRITDVQREVVKKLLAKLQESDRTIVTLYYLGGMTYEEISQFLGVSVSAIKNRLYRARQSLKKEEPVVREALGNFQITPNLTANIMQEIARIKPAVPSSVKPSVPWAIAASTVVVMLLMLGIGSQRYAIRFQQPYSLDAASEVAIELLETPLVLNRVSKLDTRTQIEIINTSRSSNTSKRTLSNTAALVADAQADEPFKDYTKWELPKEAKIRLGKGRINAIQFSPNGNELAVASSIGIWMYSVATGDELALFTGHAAQIQSLAFSLDGKILASTGNDGTIRVWDTETGKQLVVLSDRRNLPGALAFSPNGTTIVSGSRTGAIQIWDVATGDPLATLTGHTDTVEALAFSPDGKTLASTSEDLSIRLWDIGSKEHRSTLTGHKKPVKVLVFSPDGNTLASAGMGGTVRLWDPGTGRQVRALVQFGLTDTDQEFPAATQQTAWIDTLAFLPDGSILASGDHHGTVRLWRLSDGSLLSTTKADMRFISTLAFSMDKPIFMTADRKGMIHSWNVSTGAELAMFTLTGHEDWGRALGFAADRTTVMTAGYKTVRFWDIEGEREFTPLVLPHSNVINAYAFSPDGKILAGTTDKNVIAVWDLQTNSQRTALVGHTWFIDTIAFSSDSTLLASGGRDGAIYVWDVETGHRKKTFKGHQISVKALAFSPDRSTLASTNHRGVRLWDVRTSTLRTSLIEHEDSGQADTLALAFSPDSKILASAGLGKISLWNVGTHRLLSELARSGARVAVLAFAPDSSILLIGCGDGTIELWDANNYTLKSTIKPHTGKIEVLRFSPGGETLATGSMDGTILLWRWASIVEKKKTN
ncbi:sigma-70 family RNA polymerase sigma factor [Candidatus Poribacteria bacterium]|nr:sigma-70 family RNA polymerase sigma factor [Candidatus Poribacteria bacterium]